MLLMYKKHNGGWLYSNLNLYENRHQRFDKCCFSAKGVNDLAKPSIFLIFNGSEQVYITFTILIKNIKVVLTINIVKFNLKIIKLIDKTTSF